MTTLGVQCYHPNLKKVIPLFKFYAEDETSPTAELALDLFNDTLKKYTEGKCQQFSPAGWMSDEAGALIKAFDTVYGSDIHSKIVTCNAHTSALLHEVLS